MQCHGFPTMMRVMNDDDGDGVGTVASIILSWTCSRGS
jgi:hypothetical protein